MGFAPTPQLTGASLVGLWPAGGIPPAARRPGGSSAIARPSALLAVAGLLVVVWGLSLVAADAPTVQLLGASPAHRLEFSRDVGFLTGPATVTPLDAITPDNMARRLALDPLVQLCPLPHCTAPCFKPARVDALSARSLALVLGSTARTLLANTSFSVEIGAGFFRAVDDASLVPPSSLLEPWTNTSCLRLGAGTHALQAPVGGGSQALREVAGKLQPCEDAGLARLVVSLPDALSSTTPTQVCLANATTADADGASYMLAEPACLSLSACGMEAWGGRGGWGARGVGPSS